MLDQATQGNQVIRTIACVLPNWADVLDTDTLLDEATGWFYLVESQQLRPGPGYYPADRLLTLRMRSGVSLASG